MLNELALFAGAGGGILGGKLLGWTTVCAVEYEDYPRRVLLQRQRDGLLPLFPIWDDVRTFDGRPWRGKVDVISGGFPCQDISSAGKGAGIEGERSGLWGEMARIISEVQPRYAFIENSPLLIRRGLQRVLCDLAEMGYDARWGIVSAENAGAQHKRERCWIVADCHKRTVQHVEFCERKTNEQREAQEWLFHWLDFLVDACGDTPVKWRSRRQETFTGPIMRRDADGMADAVDRIAAIGNGQVPQAMALAWKILTS